MLCEDAWSYVTSAWLSAQMIAAQLDLAVRTRICSRRHRALEEKLRGFLSAPVRFFIPHATHALHGSPYYSFTRLHISSDSLLTFWACQIFWFCQFLDIFLQVHRLRRQLQELQAHRFALNLTQSWMAIWKRSSHLLSLFESVWAKKMLGPTWAVFVYLSLVSTSCGKVGREWFAVEAPYHICQDEQQRSFLDIWRRLQAGEGTLHAWRTSRSSTVQTTHTQILWVGIWQIWHKNSFADTI